MIFDSCQQHLDPRQLMGNTVYMSSTNVHRINCSYKGAMHLPKRYVVCAYMQRTPLIEHLSTYQLRHLREQNYIQVDSRTRV
jgi:hypothetical protein